MFSLSHAHNITDLGKPRHLDAFPNLLNLLDLLNLLNLLLLILHNNLLHLLLFLHLATHVLHVLGRIKFTLIFEISRTRLINQESLITTLNNCFR